MKYNIQILRNLIAPLFLICICCVVVRGQIKQQEDFYKQSAAVFHQFVEELKKIDHPLYAKPLPDFKNIHSYIIAYDPYNAIHAPIKNEMVKIELEELRFMLNSTEGDITITPIDSTKNKNIYEHLTNFTRDKTFVVSISKDPSRILLYLLIIPGDLIKQPSPKIFSWKLVHFNGRYHFQNLLSQVGTEAKINPRYLVSP